MAPAPKFSLGDQVRVKVRHTLGHIRTPEYLRGKSGEVERVLGVFGNPEELAYGRHDDRRQLYRVRFLSRDVWPDASDDRGTIDAEIYEHWLEPSE